MPKKLVFRLLLAGLLWAAFIFTPAFGKTDNLNVLFLGFESNKLEMISVYSVNHQDQMQSGAVFVPVQSLVPGETLVFRDYYKNQGINRLKDKIEKILDIKIAYHVIIDNQIMEEAEKITGPIMVEGKRIDLKKIFTAPAGPQDEQVLGQLMARFTQKEVYFWKLPLLIKAYKRYVTTDFPLTIENLLLHYRIASKIPTDKIKKVILPCTFRPAEVGDRRIYFWQLDEEYLSEVIYSITK